jgi:hypothetical protein
MSGEATTSSKSPYPQAATLEVGSSSEQASLALTMAYQLRRYAGNPPHGGILKVCFFGAI